MRIIGGTHGGRVINPPLKKWPTRPTTDMAKEALFNILANQISFADCSMIDLFGGTGAHALEFLSRGSEDVTYVDTYGKCVRWFSEEIKKLKFEDATVVLKADVFKYITKCTRKFDIIFADPPYALESLADIPNMIFENNLLQKDGIVILEHGNNLNFEDHANFQSQRTYGQSRFSFFQ